MTDSLYERPTVKLNFDSPEFEGLVVRARRLTLGQLRAIDELYSIDDDSPDDDPAMREQAIADMVVRQLISWNLAEEGERIPLPQSGPEFVRGFDAPLIGTVVSGLIRASRDVAPPLSQPSDGSSPTSTPDEQLEMDLPMADPPLPS